MAEAVGRDPLGHSQYITDTIVIMQVDPQGNAAGRIDLSRFADRAVEIFALVSGTQFLDAATTGFYPIGGYNLYLPAITK
jgi:hypothetical protein